MLVSLAQKMQDWSRVDWSGPAQLQDRAEPDAGNWGCVEGVGWAVTEQGGESGVSLAKFFVLCCSGAQAKP